MYMSNIEASNNIEDIASKLGLRTFAKEQNGIDTKSITGMVKKKDLKELSKTIGRKINPIANENL